MRASTFVHQWNPGVLEHHGDPKLLNKFAWQIHHLKMIEGKVLAQQQVSLSKDPLKTQWATKTERMAFVSNFGRTPALLLSSANGLFSKLNLFLCLIFHIVYFCMSEWFCFRHWHWNQRVFSMLCMSPPCFKTFICTTFKSTSVLGHEQEETSVNCNKEALLLHRYKRKESRRPTYTSEKFYHTLRCHDTMASKLLKQRKDTISPWGDAVGRFLLVFVKSIKGMAKNYLLILNSNILFSLLAQYQLFNCSEN